MTLSALPLGVPASLLPGGLDTTTRIVDSHTDGGPTRLVVSGGPALYGVTMAQRLDELRQLHDAWRRALVTAPRGHSGLVGALLTEPERPGSQAGILFFDQDGYLDMHGPSTVGVVASLAHLGKVRPGPLWLDTPVGTVHAEFMLDGGVTLRWTGTGDGAPTDHSLAGRAYVMLEGSVVIQPDDPLGWGTASPVEPAEPNAP